MRSMTGYGSYTQDAGALQIAIRIRSVNHRNLDLVVRMPEEYRSLELDVRERVGCRLNRGRVELRLDVEDQRDRAVRVNVNRSWIEGLLQAKKELEEAQLDLGNLGLGDLLRNPDALRISTVGNEVDDQTSTAILKATDAALDELVSSRSKEGGRLREFLEGHLDSLSELVQEIAGDQEAIRREQEERLRRRIQELVSDAQNLDPGRLEQEVAYLAERSDVREELDRLVTHIGHFRDTMTQSGPTGKKLDFIAQEISRELTTLGAKCRQAGVLQRHVEAKLICEQIREQVQNIE